MAGSDENSEIKQHQRYARSGTLSGSGAEEVEEIRSHRGKEHGDAMNTNMLQDHERAKGKGVKWSKHHAAAEAAPDHGKMGM